MASNDLNKIDDKPLVKPVPSFFLSISEDDPCSSFRKLFGGVDGPSAFTNSVFLVLHKRSEEDKSCAVLSIFVRKGEVRTEFAVSNELVCHVDVQ